MINDFSKVTDGSPQGEGLFDQLMRSVKAHLLDEYDNQRIRGSDYANVYIASIQNAMSQAIQWQLSAEIQENQAAILEQQALSAAKQVELADQQVLLAIKQNDQADIQTTQMGIQTGILEDDATIKEKQIEQVTEEVLITKQQLEIAKNNVSITSNQATLIGNQANNEAQRLSILQQEAINAASQNLNIVEATAMTTQQIKESQQRVVSAQLNDNLTDERIKQEAENLKILQERVTAAPFETDIVKKNADLMTSKIALESQQVANMQEQEALIQAQAALAQANGQMVAKQLDTESKKQRDMDYNYDNVLPVQTNILNQKLKTEAAQINDRVDGVLVTGTVGKRNQLLEEQAQGFIKDGQQKAVKQLLDTWGMGIGSALSGEEFPASVRTDNLDSALNELRQGAGLSSGNLT